MPALYFGLFAEIITCLWNVQVFHIFLAECIFFLAVLSYLCMWSCVIEMIYWKDRSQQIQAVPRSGSATFNFSNVKWAYELLLAQVVRGYNVIMYVKYMAHSKCSANTSSLPALLHQEMNNSKTPTNAGQANSQGLVSFYGLSTQVT